MDHLTANENNDWFAEDEEWIAAQARILFRARRAADGKAVEVAMFYLEHYLVLTLRRHLRETGLGWDSSGRWIDGLSQVQSEYLSPGRMRIRAEATWVDQEKWYDDPFEFELELCPRTGAFRMYVFRFGDYRPLTAKGMGREVVIPPKDGWAFEFQRVRSADMMRMPGETRPEWQ